MNRPLIVILNSLPDWMSKPERPMSAVFEERRKLDPVTLPLKTQLAVMPIDDATIRHQSSLYWEWKSAFEHDPAASPLQHPDIVLAELSQAKNSSRIAPVAICERSTPYRTVVAILVPKSIRTSQVGGVGPDRRLDGLRLVGGRMLGRIASAEQEQLLLQSAARYATETQAEFLLIDDLDEASTLSTFVRDQSIHDCLLFVTHEVQPHHHIDFPASEAEYLETFSNHCRKLFRRAMRKCSAAHLERVTEINQLPDFLQAAHEISRQSWQSQQFGMRVRNDEAELDQMAALAIHGLLRCYLFRIDGIPAAFAVGNQHAGCFRYEETAFAPQFRHLSPGRTMFWQIISDLFSYNSPRSLDFGLGDAEYKRQFANRTTRSCNLWLVPPTLRARMSLAHLNVCRCLRSAIYSTIKQSGLGTKARQWIRSKSTDPNPATIDQSTDAAESSAD